MDGNLLVILALVLAWISGLLAGLGFKRKSLLEREIGDDDSGQTGGKAPESLPVTQIEVSHGAHHPRGPTSAVSRQL